MAAATLDDQEAWSQPAGWADHAVERGLVQRAGLAPAARYCPIPEDGVTNVKKIIGKPYAGKPHVRIERGMGKRARKSTAPLTTNGATVGDTGAQPARVRL